MIRVFVSSVSSDLEAVRKQIISDLQTAGYDILCDCERIRVMTSTCLILIALLLGASCCSGSSSTQTEVVWRKLGSWSGRGSMQTEPFLSDTGSLRLHWETRNETAAGTGTFRVTVHSDVSGRPLVVAVDARGVGRDTTYVSEDPRPFFLVVDAANLEWTLDADEPVTATHRAAGGRRPRQSRRTGR